MFGLMTAVTTSQGAKGEGGDLFALVDGVPVPVAARFQDQEYINAITIIGDTLYAPTGDEAMLFKLSTPMPIPPSLAAYDPVAETVTTVNYQFDRQTELLSFTTDDGVLLGTTGSKGLLLKAESVPQQRYPSLATWDGTTLTVVAETLNNENSITSLTDDGTYIYGSTAPSGCLFRY